MFECYNVTSGSRSVGTLLLGAHGSRVRGGLPGQAQPARGRRRSRSASVPRTHGSCGEVAVDVCPEPVDEVVLDLELGVAAVSNRTWVRS
jgi:hypothetical protein